MVADGVPGMAARHVGRFKAAFVSRIVMVRGTGMGTLGGTGTADQFRGRSSLGGLIFSAVELKFFRSVSDRRRALVSCLRALNQPSLQQIIGRRLEYRIRS